MVAYLISVLLFLWFQKPIAASLLDLDNKEFNKIALIVNQGKLKTVSAISAPLSLVLGITVILEMYGMTQLQEHTGERVKLWCFLSMM